MKYLIALPITKIGFMTEDDIVFLHMSTEADKGAVYFSTNNRILPKKAAAVSYVLFVSKNLKSTYIANVKDYQYFDCGGRTSDAEIYCVEQFKNSKDKHWFKLENIRTISDDELKKLLMYNTAVQKNYHNVYEYISGSKRLQVFYAFEN